MTKRKRDSVVAEPHGQSVPALSAANSMGPTPGLRATRRNAAQSSQVDANPDTNFDVKDGQSALRASPAADGHDEKFAYSGTTIKKGKRAAAAATAKPTTKRRASSSPLSDLPDVEEHADSDPAFVQKAAASRKGAPKDVEVRGDGDLDMVGEDDAAHPDELKEAFSRPPPVHSSYLPLPWKGRLGYACLNTYLRTANPPVFSSRTCRIASILEHRHPLKDPSQPEHATKNRPDKDQPADVARGQAYVEALGVANAKDIVKMLLWNDKYGIKFLRLSSEMFPFASHAVYGYRLAPFASEALAEAGRVAAELGHRLTTHPGQFTQLGSPRPEVITASIRDLEYHCELLDLLKLPPQQNRDAVMILHMGGVFGDKAATLERFTENYLNLSQRIKDRLVLENDDVCYTVHDLLPVCEELNIPLVLDYHHHNILFDAEQLREGTLDIMSLYDRIKATWDRKNIKQKMHYSEPTPAAITARQRRKHNPRVATLPPCAPDMDLMIEAKDKEQACFELMRTFKLPGYETFSDVVPYVRNDENRPWKPPAKKKTLKRKGAQDQDGIVEDEPEQQPPPIIPNEEVSMGGPDGRVYWPPTMEEWLRPKKREVKPRDAAKTLSTAEKATRRRAEKAAWQANREASAEAAENQTEASVLSSETGDVPKPDIEKTRAVYNKASIPKAKPTRSPKAAESKKSAKTVPTPSTSEYDDRDDGADDVDMLDLTDHEERAAVSKNGRRTRAPSRRQSSRGAKNVRVVYADGEDDGE